MLRLIKFLILVTFLMLPSVAIYSQSLPPSCSTAMDMENPLKVRTLVSGNVTVCGPSVTFTVELENAPLNPTSINITEANVSVLLPVGMEYTGNLSGASGGVVAGSNNRLIEASLNTGFPIVYGNKTSFSFTARARCDIFSNLAGADLGQIVIRNQSRVCYKKSDGNTQYSIDELEGSGSYNIIYPSLEVTMSSQDNKKPGVPNELVSRVVRVTNSGLGSIDMSKGFEVKVDYPIDNSLTYDNATVSSAGVSGINITVSGTGRSRVFSIKGSSSFERNEVIEITETVRVASCNLSSQTDYVVEWGCDENICNQNQNNAKLSSYVNVPLNMNPNITFTVLNSPQFSYCSGDVTTYHARLENIGNTATNGVYTPGNRATNVNVLWYIQSAGLAKMSVSNFRIKSGNNWVSIPTQLLSTYGDGQMINFNNMLNNDIDGPGGLEDLDGDNFYDDLAVGAVVELQVDLHMKGCNFGKGENGVDHIDDYFVYINLGYANACGNGFHYRHVYQDRLYSPLNSQSIDGNEDILPSETPYIYTFQMDRSRGYGDVVSRMGCSSESYYSYITVPAGLKLANSTGVTWNGQIVTGVVQNPTTGVIYIPHGGLSGEYKVPLILDCEGVGTNFGPELISWEMRYMCSKNGGCSCEQLFAKTDYEVFVHRNRCGEGSSCGLITDGFNSERSTIGYAMPSGRRYLTVAEYATAQPANKSQIRLDRGLEYDEISLDIPGTMTGTTAINNAHVKVHYTMAGQNILELRSVTAKVTRGGTDYVIGHSNSLPLNFSQSGSEYFVNIDLNLSAVGGSLVEGDKIHVEAKVMIQKNNYSTGYHRLRRFRAEYWWNDDQGQRKSCSSFGSRFTFIKKVLSPSSEVTLSDDCSMNRYAWLNVSGGDVNDFPNEYRPLGHIESASYQLPDNTSYVQGSTLLVNIDDNILPDAGITSSDGSNIYRVSSTSNPLTLNWARQGSWPVTDDEAYYWHRYEILQFRLNSPCNPNPSIYYDNTPSAVNFVYRQYDYAPAYVETISTVSANKEQDQRNLHTSHELTFSADVDQEGYSETVTWPVYICNTANTTPNTWLRIKPAPGNVGTIQIMSAADVTAGSHTNLEVEACQGCTEPGIYLVKLNTIAAAQCREIRITGKYSGCQEDKVDVLEVLGSWHCNEYPAATELANPPCTDPSSIYSYSTFSGALRLRYKTAGMAIAVSSNKANDEVDLCEEIEYEVKLTGDMYADMNDISFRIELPQGVVPVNGANGFASYIYPSNGTATGLGQPAFIERPDAINDKVYGFYSWNLFPHLHSVNSTVPDQLPGSRVLHDTDPDNNFNNEIRLKFRLQTSCPHFDQGYPIRFYATGKTNCNLEIIKNDQRKIKRKNFTPDDLEVQLSPRDNSNFNGCGSQVIFDLKIKNNTIATQYDNKLRVLLPFGISSISAQGAIVKEDFPSEGETTLEWIIPAGFTGEELFPFTAGLANNNVTGPVEISAATTITSENVICISSLESCNLTTTTGGASVSVPVSVNPPVAVINHSGTLPLCPGSSVDLSTSVSYPGGVSSSYSCAWTGAGLSEASSCSPTVSPQTSTTYTVVVTDTKGCSTTANIHIPVHPKGEINITQVKGISCQGRSDGRITLTASTLSGASQLELRLLQADVPLSTVMVSNGASHMFTSLAMGSYVVSFTDPVTNCVVSVPVEVGYAGPSIQGLCTSRLGCQQSSGTSKFRFTVMNPSVNNAGSYTYQILDGITAKANLQGQTIFSGSYGQLQTVEIAAAEAGKNYNVRVTDQSGCVINSQVDVSALEFVVNTGNRDIDLCYIAEKRPVKISVSHNETCVSLPEITYLYKLWRLNEGTGVYVQVGSDIQVQQSEYEFKELSAGKYKARVDMLTSGYELCGDELEFEMKGLSTFTVDLIKHPVRCFGTATGSAQAKVNGGYDEIFYEWRNAATKQVISSDAFAEGLEEGKTYELYVRDGRGCLDPYYHSFMLPEGPVKLNNPVITDGQDCDASASVSGGTAPYIFNWYKLNTVAGETTRALVFSEQPAGNTSYVSGLTKGTYQVEVTDASECISSSQADLSQRHIQMTYKICMSWNTYKGFVKEKEKDDDDPGLPQLPGVDISTMVINIQDTKAECAKKQLKVAEEIYKKICLDADYIDDELKIDYQIRYEHFTLYYYDRGGRLVKTVPPRGVTLLNPAVNNVKPDHKYVTTYEYNSLGQLVRQNTPDGGTSNFVYNNKGQLRFSQNAQQSQDGHISFSNYDNLGRITEVGQATSTLSGPSQDEVFSDASSEQNTYTVYTQPAGWISYQGQPQRYLRNRVSYSYTINQNGDKEYSYYSYDAHGNVEWVVQEIGGFSKNTIAYEYDLISNKVLKVKYNEGRSDQFFHRYSYDEDNRITMAETSKDGVIWDKDAKYSYYLHGPLKRTELGEDKVQGLDYAYTISGWLKGVNSANLNPSQDLGNDGTNTLAEGSFAPDVFGMSLSYFSGDYVAGNSFSNSVYNIPGAKDLYNGNISAWSDKIGFDDSDAGGKYSNQLTGHRYTYDKLNRLREAEFASFNGGSWNVEAGENGAYYSSYTYDANGNIVTLKRNAYNDAGKVTMDRLTYHYEDEKNRLNHVDESLISNTHNGTKQDIIDQQENNYTYDKIGNLTKDIAEDITIKWNVYGKVSEVIPCKAEQADKQKYHIKFSYDATGNRVKKEVNTVPVFNGNTLNEAAADITNITISYYVRDASGNTMAVYERSHEPLMEEGVAVADMYKAVYRLKEQSMYGSSRLGQLHEDKIVGEKIFHKNDYAKVSFEFEDFERVSTLAHMKGGAKRLDIYTQGETEHVIQVAGLQAVNPADGSITEDVSFIGKTANEIAVAEEAYTRALQFYAAGADYWGAENTMLIYDKNNMLMKGSADIVSEKGSKSVAVKKPGRNKEYYLFHTVSGKLRYHTIDMSQQGYGAEEATGELTSSAEMQGGHYGRHLAVIEDYVKNKSYVYATSYDETSHKTSLLLIEIGEQGPESPEIIAEYESYDEKGDGELQISPDGKKIAIYNHKKAYGFFAHRDIEVITYALDGNHKVIDDSRDFTSRNSFTYTYGNHPKGSVEFGSTSGWIYVGQTSLVNFLAEGVNKQIIKEKLSEETIVTGKQISTGYRGDLRRSESETVYLIRRKQQVLSYWSDAVLSDHAVTDVTHEGVTFTGYLAYQPHRILPKDQIEVVALRSVGNKYYEITDHLGNVRVVVTDVKAATVSGGAITGLKADVKSYNNYYAFGMLQPGRSYSPKEYRYSFNGAERDDEIKGAGNSLNFTFRIYDPRLGRWLSIDPLASVQPAWSPYHFGANNPIWNIDIDGLIPYPITVRSFAPFKSFGGGFHGDDRGFSTSSTATARVHQKIDFDTDKTTLKTNVWSSPTWHTAAPWFQRTATPSVEIEKNSFKITKSGDVSTFTFRTHYSGANPLTPGAPNIDVFTDFTISENKKAGILSISGKLTGDNFPSTEAFISDPSGQNVFIGVGFYEGSPFSSLWGENKDRKITDFNFTINTDKDGNFTGVNAGGKDYSISDWNKMFETADPHKNAE